MDNKKELSRDSILLMFDIENTCSFIKEQVLDKVDNQRTIEVILADLDIIKAKVNDFLKKHVKNE